MSETDALKRWQLENKIEYLEMDQIFRHDAAAIQSQMQAAAWKKEYLPYISLFFVLRYFVISFSLTIFYDYYYYYFVISVLISSEK